MARGYTRAERDRLARNCNVSLLPSPPSPSFPSNELIVERFQRDIFVFPSRSLPFIYRFAGMDSLHFSRFVSLLSLFNLFLEKSFRGWINFVI